MNWRLKLIDTSWNWVVDVENKLDLGLISKLDWVWVLGVDNCDVSFVRHLRNDLEIELFWSMVISNDGDLVLKGVNFDIEGQFWCGISSWYRRSILMWNRVLVSNAIDCIWIDNKRLCSWSIEDLEINIDFSVVDGIGFRTCPGINLETCWNDGHCSEVERFWGYSRNSDLMD